MRVVNDLNRGSNNYYSQNPPSFGAVYSKSSVKLLKKFIPEIINEEGFEFAQKALNNLAQTGKRKDNLILKFKDVDQLVRNFVREKFQDLSQEIQDKAEAISESVYTIDGTKPKSKWAFLANIKDLFTKNQYQYTDKQKEEAKILAGMIDNLPTYNK